MTVVARTGSRELVPANFYDNDDFPPPPSDDGYTGLSASTESSALSVVGGVVGGIFGGPLGALLGFTQGSQIHPKRKEEREEYLVQLHYHNSKRKELARRHQAMQLANESGEKIKSARIVAAEAEKTGRSEREMHTALIADSRRLTDAEIADSRSVAVAQIRLTDTGVTSMIEENQRKKEWHQIKVLTLIAGVSWSSTFLFNYFVTCCKTQDTFVNCQLAPIGTLFSICTAFYGTFKLLTYIK